MARLSTAGDSAALSKELADFLIEFSIGLHKNAIYPPGHPLLQGTSAELSRRLEALLKERTTLSLGVARNQLIIEGVATEEKNPVLRELAARLHRHHLGAVKFSQGVTEDELVHMLATAAVDSGRLPRPLGMEGPEVLAQWAHIRLFPMTFAQLQLIEENPNLTEEEADDQIRATGAGNRSAQLWIGLARAALVNQLGGNVTEDDAESADPKLVAKAIEETKRDAAYDQVVVGYLLQIAEEIKTKGGKEQAALKKRVSQLMGSLSTEARKRILEMGGDFRQRKKFVADAAQGMAAEAVIDLVKAAAETSGQTISHSMVRMLNKMAVHTDSSSLEVRTQADGALRDQVQQLIAGWELEDPNPDGYRLALEKLARNTTRFTNIDNLYPIEPERLIEMGIEIETLGDQMWRSADALAAKGELLTVIAMVESAKAPWIRDVMWRHIATPTRLREMLTTDPFPMAALQKMVPKMGVGAVEPLLDAMDEATDDRANERYLDLLNAVGPEAGPVILDRLPGLRWSLVRPLLALLGKNPEWNCGYDAAQWLTHPDALVRREALRQQLRAPETRELAIVRALADADEATLRLGLGAAMTNCPRDAATMLRVRADDATINEDLRALGVRALASYRAPDTAAWLAQQVVKTSKLLKRPTLANKSPVMLAALEGLATHWRTDKQAKEAIALASASSDQEIRDAISVRPPRAGVTNE
ncbi:MAG: hypothetical protein IT357_09730 [Gemmatimonadaceae bacterium]|nr:hypothetical protein [Gemmatimonadaceae bacterium]